MKLNNPINFVFAILVLMVLGCACPQLDRLIKREPPPPPPPAPSAPSAPANTSRPSGPSSSSALTMEKFNQLRMDMDRSEVERILGGPGEEISTSTGGGMTFSVYRWSGENFTSIIISFKDDKIMSKSQVGLK